MMCADLNQFSSHPVINNYLKHTLLQNRKFILQNIPITILKISVRPGEVKKRNFIKRFKSAEKRAPIR